MYGIERKHVKTFFLALVWVSMGMNIEIAGPTLIDLKLRLHSTYNDVSRSVSGRGFGNFLGAIFGGILVDKLEKWNELNIAVTRMFVGLTVAAIPFIRNTTLLWIAFFTSGALHGATNVAGQRIVLEIWQEKAAGPMHLIHTGYGVGAILLPLIANPFLAEFTHNTTAVNVSDGYVTVQPIAATTSDSIISKESRIQYAYLTVAGFDILLVFPFMLFQIVTLYSHSKKVEPDIKQKGKRTLKEMFNPATYANGSLHYGIAMFILLFFYFFNLIGNGKMFSNFVRSFSIDALKFSKDLASYLNMAYWASFTSGRFLGFFTAKYFSIKRLFIAEVTFSIITLTLLDLFSTKDSTAFWVTVLLLGFSLGPLTPSSISFGNTYIEVTGICLMMITLGGGVGESVFIWIAGIFYDSHGPRTILYILQAGGVLVFITSVIMAVISWSRQDRFKAAKNIQFENKPSESDPLISR